MATSDVAWLKALTQVCNRGADVAAAIVEDEEFLECWESDFSQSRLQALVQELKT